MSLPGRIADAPPPYQSVVFDCDSTLCAIEGVDELARLRGSELAAELAALTERAMRGEVPLEAVYGARLERVRPTRAELQAVGERYVETLLPGARELVGALRAAGVRVRIVSGGLLEPVRLVGAALGLPPDDVHAVPTRHGRDGAYAGFAEACPLARAGGKLELARALTDLGGFAPAALVGDGATDLEAAPALARFVAFGGVVRREAVHAAAAVASTAADLRALGPLLLSPEQLDGLRRDPAHAPLFAPPLHEPPPEPDR